MFTKIADAAERQKHFDNYTARLREGCNFTVMPIKKIIEKDGDYVRRTLYRCNVIDSSGNESIVLFDSDHLLDAQVFIKVINKYIGLKVYGLDAKSKEKASGGKDEKSKESESKESKKSIIIRLRLLKDFFDFCTVNDMLTVEEQLSYLGFSRDGLSDIMFINGILNLEKKVFTPKQGSLRNVYTIKHHAGDEIPLQECLPLLAKLPDEVLKSDGHKFVLGGFFIASIRANEFFEYYQNFPLFYIFGPRGSGKSFIYRLLMSIVGYVKIDLIDLSKMSPFSLIDLISGLKRYIFTDEYSSIRKHKEFVNSMLRGNYDRTFSHRGAPGNGFENKSAYTKNYENDSVLYVCGETLPDDEALLTRAILIESESDFTHRIGHADYKELTSKYRKLFFNAVKFKTELDIEPYIEQAEQLLEKHKVNIKEQRTKNNLCILIAGNLIAGNTDETWIMDNVYAYLKNYDTLFKINTMTHEILDDVNNFPDEYLSLNKVLFKQQKYPIFLYGNQMIINMRLLINIYQFRHKDRDINKPKIENELKSLLGISGKISKSEFNYVDFAGKRQKGPAISYAQVKANIYTARLWNTFVSKLDNDKTNYEYTISEDIENKINASLSLHQPINLEEIGETEKQEKEKI